LVFEVSAGAGKQNVFCPERKLSKNTSNAHVHFHTPIFTPLWDEFWLPSFLPFRAEINRFSFPHVPFKKKSKPEIDPTLKVWIDPIAEIF